MAIDLSDLANIVDKIVLSEHWKWLFRASRFQNFLGEKNLRPPQAAHPMCDPSVIEKYPHFTYSKGWTVSMRTCSSSDRMM